MRYWEKEGALFRGKGRIEEVYIGAGKWKAFPKDRVDHVHSQADEVDEAEAQKWMKIIDPHAAKHAAFLATDEGKASAAHDAKMLGG
jgi:hypothetical protein